MGIRSIGLSMAVVGLGLCLGVTGCGYEIRKADSSTSSSEPDARASTSSSPSSEATLSLSWPEVARQVSPAVVRIQTVYCDSEPMMGSGFVVDAHDVVTAAHVVDQAVGITVQSGSGETLPAQLVAMDVEHDAAMIRVDADLDAQVHLAEADPEMADEIGILGYPLATFDLKYVQGTVSGHVDSLDYGDGRHVVGLLQTDAAVNTGNSGGPAVDHSGAVIGLVTGKVTQTAGGDPIEGTAFLIPVSEFAASVEQWSRADTASFDSCHVDASGSEGYGTPADVTYPSGVSEAKVVAQTLFTYFLAVNGEMYDVAWAYFTEDEQSALGGLEKWSAGIRGSIITSFAIADVTPETDGLTHARGTLETQTTSEGATTRCQSWDMDYQLGWVGGSYLIQRVKGTATDHSC